MTAGSTRTQSKGWKKRHSTTIGVEVPMKHELMALRDGRITFDAFAQQTSTRWRYLAEQLLRRWRAPAAVEVADLQQELLIGAWAVLPRWQPARGTSVERYVIFNAMSQAKRWLHVQRGVRRNRSGPHPDRVRSRHPIAVADLEVQTEPTQTDAIDAKRRSAEALMKVAALRTDRDKLCASLFTRTGSIDRATDLLWSNLDLREQCGFKSRAAARRQVYRATRRAAGLEG
jgi:hypothetical protein